MASKPTALFLSPEWPYPIIGGGALRAASVLEYLLARYQVDVICFRQPEATSVAPSNTRGDGGAGLRRWSEIPLPEHGKSVAARGWRNLTRALRGVPPLVDRFRGFESEVRAAIGDETYDVTVVEHFWCSDYTQFLRGCSKKLVLDMHNAESLWHRRCGQAAPTWERPFYWRFARVAERMEAERLPVYDLILPTSQTESDYISARLPGLPLIVVPNTIPVQPLPQVEREDSIVFSGNMEYMPNQRAVEYFASEIWPHIRRRHPHIRWKILGKSASILRQRLEGTPRLFFVSDPDDAMIEIAKSKVAVVPLTAGAGTRLKIVEAWAAGCPVVSTTIGAEGLEYSQGTDILIQDSPDGFAEQVSRLIEHRPLADNLRRAGRQRFEQSYSWVRAWEALRACGL